jgi:hypothetical protein
MSKHGLSIAHRTTKETLVFDVGQNILGIYAVKRRSFVQYRNDDIRRGAQRLVRAREIVSWWGNLYDFPTLAKKLGLREGEAPRILGIHVDMAAVCWGQIQGSNLRGTYLRQFSEVPISDGTHEGDNKCDVQMTFRLWQCWKAGTLKL